MKKSDYFGKVEADLVWKPWGIETPEREWRFHPKRRWRFDYAWVGLQVAVEIDGAIWAGGRHTRSYGFLADMEKRNEAQRMGWNVYHFTPQQLKDGSAQRFIKQVMEAKNDH